MAIDGHEALLLTDDLCAFAIACKTAYRAASLLPLSALPPMATYPEPMAYWP
jgi:hypothetical protein